MSDNVIDEKDSEEESFADLFESYGAGMHEYVQIGDKIRGEIISMYCFNRWRPIPKYEVSGERAPFHSSIDFGPFMSLSFTKYTNTR